MGTEGWTAGRLFFHSPSLPHAEVIKSEMHQITPQLQRFYFGTLQLLLKHFKGIRNNSVVASVCTLSQSMMAYSENRNMSIATGWFSYAADSLLILDMPFVGLERLTLLVSFPLPIPVLPPDFSLQSVKTLRDTIL